MKILYHKRRGIAQLLILMMALAVISVIPATAVEAGDVIYSEGFESENTLQQNGNATFALSQDFAAAGTTSLSVSPTAENNYSGVALRNDSLKTPMVPGGKYKLTAKAYSAKDATLGVRVETKDSSGGNTYGSVGSTKPTLTAGQWVDVVMDFTVPADHQSVTAIVFHNDDRVPEFTFYLDDVKLEVTAPPAPVAEQKITQLLSFTFDDKAERESLFAPASGSSSIEWLGEAGVGQDDGNVLKVTHVTGQDYTSANNAIRLTLKDPLPAGGVYNISVWFYAPAAGNENKETLTGPGVVINQQYAQGAFKLPSNFGTLPIGEWKQVNVNSPMMETPLTTIDFRLVVNDEAKHADVWYIDNIVISQVGELQKIETIVPEWDLSLVSLAETYKNDFLLGNIMSAGQTTDAETTAMYKHQYNVVTAENDMKPQYISPAKGTYNYTNSDTLVDWAEANNQKVHGHTLVWHSQSAPWLTSDSNGKALTRAEARANMKEYIDNVAGHFKGRVISWDVVNEAFDGGTAIPTDWKTVLRFNSPWYIAYENGADKSKGESGADYIYDAFVYARLADPDAILYYNDYNETEAWKREAIALMAEDLNEKWKTDSRNKQPERLLIEGLGMQSHYWTANMNISEVDATIARFAKTGAEVSVTELDIPYGSYANQHNGPLSEEQEINQAKLYAQLFEVYKKHADSIARVTIWGKADPQSWRAQGRPVLFDQAFAAKEAFYASINPENYMISNFTNPYSDVTAKDWFYNDVAYVSSLNLTAGTSATTFGTDMKVTWGQFLTMLYRLDGQSGIPGNALWNAAAGDWAVSNGLVDADFRFYQLLSREDMAIIIEKYIAYSGRSISSATTHAYVDDTAISAKSAVNILYNAGIITGKPGNIFDPQGTLTRAEIATIFHRLANAIEPGVKLPPAGKTYEAYPALKNVYKDYFSVGIFGRGEVNALIHNYASYAPGNEMKPESTQSVKGTFTYSSADNAFSNLTSRNPEMLFYGHTLAWHSQSPTWMWDAAPARYEQPGTFDRDTALANLNNHIENVLGYYGGRLAGIDVVNEAIGTADPDDWKASLAKGEGWYMALGWEWVELSFLKAAEVVDSHPEWDCKLIYNDFGLNSPNKARAVYEMVKDINERYAGVRPNGKPLIEVIGMQCHYNSRTNTSNVEAAIALFATLPGVSVNITEMDVGCPPVGTLTPENENNQAMKFAELFRIFKKYAAGPANDTGNPKVITRVCVCGVRDAVTGWRAGEYALLFNSDGYAKQSLIAALNPEAFLATHEYIEQDTAAAPEPVDGIHVYDTGRGDGYSGANIILGNDETKWPWSLADSDGKVAFTPEKDATYRLTLNYTSKGTSAIRIRWVKDNTNGSYTDADGAVVNDYQYSADQVSTTIPAYFNRGMVNSGSYTLTTEIKLDGSQSANGLIGNIAIRGGGGGSAYTINWIKIEKIGTGGASDKLLVSWPNE